MKKVLLIGKFDNDTRKIGDAISKQFMVQLSSEDHEIAKAMIYAEKPDLIAVSLSGSAVFARDMFAFLLTYDIPLLGIGDASHEAELFINSYLSNPNVLFLKKPANPEDILESVRRLIGKGSGTSGAKGETTVLLVDDSSTFLRFMQSILSERYKVMFATSGAQAIAAVAKKKPDIILLDYEMPVCDGKKTLEMLRSEDDTKDIPVVFLTGISDTQHVKNVLNLRPEGYLLKPCSEEKVIEMIEKVLRKS